MHGHILIASFRVDSTVVNSLVNAISRVVVLFCQETGCIIDAGDSYLTLRKQSLYTVLSSGTVFIFVFVRDHAQLVTPEMAFCGTR